MITQFMDKVIEILNLSQVKMLILCSGFYLLLKGMGYIYRIRREETEREE